LQGGHFGRQAAKIAALQKQSAFGHAPDDKFGLQNLVLT
jgi:hypothetical protein